MAYDMIGMRFGKLKVLARAENDAHGKAQWVCRCDCGGAHIARGTYLRSHKVAHCPLCNLAGGWRNVHIHAWYYVEMVGVDVAGKQGFADGNAGFAVAYIGEREVACTPWYVGRTGKRRPNPVLAQAVRYFAREGFIHCGHEPGAVTGWIRRHKADIAHHGFGDGQPVWAQWYGRTNEWRGPGTSDPDEMGDVCLVPANRRA